MGGVATGDMWVLVAQYLVGDWDFHCLSNLLVRPPVLIPRPETEVRA